MKYLAFTFVAKISNIVYKNLPNIFDKAKKHSDVTQTVPNTVFFTNTPICLVFVLLYNNKQAELDGYVVNNYCRFK
jgi:hypothetical protein